MPPPNHHAVEITVLNGIGTKGLNEPALPGRADRDMPAACAFGSAWCKEKRALIPLVPSVVARVDRNVLINPQHPEFGRVTHCLHRPVVVG